MMKKFKSLSLQKKLPEEPEADEDNFKKQSFYFKFPSRPECLPPEKVEKKYERARANSFQE